MAWNHQVLFVCPAGFESTANQLAKAMQHQPGDANTFGRIWYSTSADGSTKDVSIASTRARDQFVAVLTDPSLFPSPPPHVASGYPCLEC